jgi:uncharacterized membrane protein YjjP (DUF1212 family)
MAEPRQISEEEQRQITRVCAQATLLQLQHGAESALAETVCRRLGLALGLEEVEVVLVANGITLTTIFRGQCCTTVRRNSDRGLNMQVVTEVQRALLRLEAGEFDLAGVSARLADIQPFRYNRWWVALMVGLSCAAFARLGQLGQGEALEWGTLGWAFAGSSLAMVVRQTLGHHGFNPLVTFALAAFVASSVAAQGVLHGWVGNPRLAMAASVLLLVPGYPLINAVSDMVKGYVNMGLSRAGTALLLLLASCGGIVLAMTVWNTWTWL